MINGVTNLQYSRKEKEVSVKCLGLFLLLSGNLMNTMKIICADQFSKKSTKKRSSLSGKSQKLLFASTNYFLDLLKTIFILMII